MMDPEQFRAGLERLGLSQTAFAKWNGLNPRTVRRWALGEANVPRHIVVILALLDAISEVGGPHLLERLLEK
ncbi:hypothetical protein UFOVP233_82 [uncultured Caudovirales phage]|uniref:HTH_XRE domain containing protein n=1 Tax=uncultured Caudovirales phage TaxID=2100421 RepID=A0A6J7WUE8_9CAUD|nr:hypothetical protein UFOVP233_82 [uncultured Caudovirales phage]